LRRYQSPIIRASLHEAGIRSCIPPKSNRKAIERMIGHLKINRAIATRYDKLARSFLDALHIAATGPRGYGFPRSAGTTV